MNCWDHLKGHTEQRELFRRSIQNGRLSHAYVLAGPEGIGKRLFARLMAQSIFCREHPLEELNVCGECRVCRSFAANTWPDYIEVGPPAGKNSIPIDAIAGAEERRGREGLCYELSMAPQSSERRVAVINDAALMTTEAANALLKTLEEPPADSLILLVSDAPDSLLPTIRSRCQTVRFFPLSRPDVEAILLSEQLAESEQEARTVAGLSEGSLETARQLLNPDLRKLNQTVCRELAQWEAMKPLAVAGSVVEGIEQMSADTPEQRRNAQWLLRFIADAVEEHLRALVQGDLSEPLTQRLGAKRGVDLLTSLLERTVTASRQIDGSAPVKLVLEALFDDLARQCRAGMKR
ncbi:MAG: DNA polymerase III subunit delta' [Planctomycetaceae bacterium]|nr:DNA polymerase III subunit delta' [Planctomycetaceae bacterium]